jgi:hypothetical protein
MQTILIAVTIASAAVAVTMCAIVIKLLREERRRSDARVEALLALAGEPSAGTQPDNYDAPVAARELHELERATPAEPAPEPVLHAGPERNDRDLVLNSVVPVTGVDGLFAEREAPSPWGRRLAVAAGCAILVTIGAFVLGSLESEAEAPGTSVQSTAATPLELLSLRHAVQREAMTITGLVQNPRSGDMVSGVTAVAFLFASDGSFLGSGRAGLDFTELKPGDESPFVVQVPNARGVARYRVSFRSRDGEVISHVDKRSAEALAQKD